MTIKFRGCKSSRFSRMLHLNFFTSVLELTRMAGKPGDLDDVPGCGLRQDLTQLLHSKRSQAFSRKFVNKRTFIVFMM